MNDKICYVCREQITKKDFSEIERNKCKRCKGTMEYLHKDCQKMCPSDYCTVCRRTYTVDSNDIESVNHELDSLPHNNTVEVEMRRRTNRPQRNIGTHINNPYVEPLWVGYARDIFTVLYVIFIFYIVGGYIGRLFWFWFNDLNIAEDYDPDPFNLLHLYSALGLLGTICFLQCACRSTKYDE
jgi:hypothetical protein